MIVQSSATAPASIGNVAVGFDILGLSFDAARDRVVAARTAEPGVRLGAVSGLVRDLPATISDNTALAAAHALLQANGAPFGVTLSIEKGVPVSAGMGGSAASAVAAVGAVNALLPAPLDVEQLFPFALEGERVASDPPPWDNVMASLLGGLVLAAGTEPPKLQRLPVPKGVVAVLAHPAVTAETRAMRALLQPDAPMAVMIEQSRRLASFIAGCATDDLDLIKAGLEDVWIEPQRSHLFPAFAEVKQAALREGALGCSLSGSGPAIFAWALEQDAARIGQAMAQACADNGTTARIYCAPLSSAGVQVDPVAAAA